MGRNYTFFDWQRMIHLKMEISQKFGGQSFRRITIVPNSSSLIGLELIACIIIIGTALPYLALFIQAKSTTSLENDEIYSITHFSSQGIIKTTTDYHVPNNHIFYNLLNALTPNSLSYEPLRSRIWSFIVVGAYLGIILVEFLRRNQFLEGAILFQIAVVNYPLMDLNLKARGYGLLTFCSIVTCLFMLRYLKDPKLRWLVIISGLTIIGVWTVPSYIFFSGLLILLLFLWMRKQAIFIAGVSVLLAITGLYAPIWTQFFENASDYSKPWGQQFSTIKTVFDVIRTYLLHSSVFGIEFKDWAIFLFLFSLAIVPYLIWKERDFDGYGVRLIFISVILVFILNLILKTAPIRTVAYVSLPLALCTVIIVGHFLRHAYLPTLSRPIIYGGIAIFFLFHNLQQINQFHFTPFEDWKGVAEYIKQTYPDGTEIFVNWATGNLKVYLDPAFPIVKKFNSEKFMVGQQVFVDSDWDNEKRVQPNMLSPNSTEFIIPQTAGGYQNIITTIPKTSWIKQVRLDNERIGPEVNDHNLSTWLIIQKLSHTLTLQIALEPNVNYRSFHMVVPGIAPAIKPEDLPVKIQAYLINGTNKELLNDEAIKLNKDAIVLVLDDQKVDYINLVISPVADDKEISFLIKEMWAYPTVAVD